MTTVGFKFTKMSGERKNASEQNIRIENNVGVTNIEETNVLDPKKSLLKFEFAFTCKYDPGLGTIDLSGELVEMFDKDLANKVMDGWKTDKKIHQDVMARILNIILARANVEAILMARELGLPSPIAMPKVEVKPKENAVKTETKLPSKADSKPEAEPKKEEKKKK